MFAFNEAISSLRLVELPLRGCKYTWTNKQQSPLLERLDWFFTSNAWTSVFPDTYASALSRDTSDHTPCVIIAATKVPRPQIFRFENYWLQHDKFMSVMQQGWLLPVASSLDSAKRITAKFKNLRKALKTWKAQLPNLATVIANSREIISFMDILEEMRDLTLEEWNFRRIVSSHLEQLLEQQWTYWKQRGTINWVKFRDECTAFFHANASIRHRINFVALLFDSSGTELTQHEAKVDLLWQAYKERMGSSEFSHMYFDLPTILTLDNILGDLERPFSKEEIEKIISELQNNKSPGPNGFNREFIKKC
jgi:hypothetical protein